MQESGLVYRSGNKNVQEVLIALGGNLPSGEGDPTATMLRAVDILDADGDISVVRVSRWYRTPAVPAGSGPDFVNGAAALATRLTPAGILARLHGVEARLGRTRPVRWAPRVCDLDLLAVGDAILPDAETVRRWMALDQAAAMRAAPPELILPHPRLHERAFVLIPLADIAPDWHHPLTGASVVEMVAALPGVADAPPEPLDT